MDFKLPEEVSNEIKSADIVVFEGFEMTGKSTLAEYIQNKYAPSYLYRPDWEGILDTNILSRGNRHIWEALNLDLCAIFSLLTISP